MNQENRKILNEEELEPFLTATGVTEEELDIPTSAEELSLIHI